MKIHPFIVLATFALLFTYTLAIRPLPRKEPSVVFVSEYNEAPKYTNRDQCSTPTHGSMCDPSLIHVAMTLDFKYLRGSIASVHSILKHSSCPENIYFHFIASEPIELERIMKSTFPDVNFRVYPFDKESRVKEMISSSIRPALDEPLNYARIYLAEMLNSCVERVVYLDSDTIMVDDVHKLWSSKLHGSKVIAAPEYCHVDIKNYFTNEFWDDSSLSNVFKGKRPCYFNTGVMVMDLTKWRVRESTKKIEEWMKVQKGRRIYNLGSLPPFLLVFGGDIVAIDHRWNQHGLGGDNVVNSCRSLHPGGVSLLHWSGKGKPWVRLDEDRACPVDYIWAPYDLKKKYDGYLELELA